MSHVIRQNIFPITSSTLVINTLQKKRAYPIILCWTHHYIYIKAWLYYIRFTRSFILYSVYCNRLCLMSISNYKLVALSSQVNVSHNTAYHRGRRSYYIIYFITKSSRSVIAAGYQVTCS